MTGFSEEECSSCNGSTVDDRMKTFKVMVEKAGCAIQMVYANSKTNSPPFFYSMGFAQFNLPDVILIGALPQKAAMITINTLLHQWREGGLKLGVNDDLLQNLDMLLLPIETSNKELYNDYVIQAIEFYERYPEFNKTEDKPVFVQMIWPDNKGQFPNQDGYDQVRFCQPVLAEFQGTVQ